jgi:dUTP pyrophosphatase
MKLKKLHPEAIIPTLGTQGAAAFDLHALLHDGQSMIIHPGGRSLVKTGIALQIPFGMVGMICSRSGLANKSGVFVLNAPGLIDSDYRGEIGVILFNASDSPFTVMRGDRIAQIMFVKVKTFEGGKKSPVRDLFEVVDNLDETDRGSGGFGSTGVVTPPKKTVD